MKILHVVAGNLNEGAARGAYWLHRGLIELGIESKILTSAEDNCGDPDVTSIISSPAQRLISRIRSRLDCWPRFLYPPCRERLFSTSMFGYNFTCHPLYEWADIIHLHWINAGMVNIRDLAGIRKPVVWTIRDMWPMTGGCHYSLNCNRYKSGCGNCPMLGGNHHRDLSSFLLNRKRRNYPHHMRIVGISTWLSELARESQIFRDFNIRTLSNNIDCQAFFPSNKREEAEMLGLNTEKRVILTGALSPKDPYKGFDEIIAALRMLDQTEYQLVIFGRLPAENISLPEGMECRNLGYIGDDSVLRRIYSAADVFVTAPRMEAFGKTLAEAMACGTPVVCSDAAGPRDIVDHQINGYRAKPSDAADLAAGISWVLSSDDYSGLCHNAREKVLRHFDIPVVARKYRDLYQEITEEQYHHSGKTL